MQLLSIKRHASLAGALVPRELLREGHGAIALGGDPRGYAEDTMPRIPKTLLHRFRLVDTAELSVARRETSRFWPSHQSRVVGPEPYAVTINRVLLGDIAITFVACTARLIVVPREPSEEACLVLPLTGCIEIDTGAGTYRAAPGTPLLRAPAMIRRFEATPTRCLMADLPMARLRATVGDRLSKPAIGHTVLRSDDADAVAAQTLALARMIDRSRRVEKPQVRSEAERRHLLPRSFQQAERQLIEVLATAAISAGSPVPPAGSVPTQISIEACLKRCAFSGLPMTEVARRAGLSMRTLQRSCEKRGFSPFDFMRGVQLDRAYHLLSQATKHDSVAAIAAKVGLTHVGRFSQAYRRRFGEPPSATLIRAARRRGASIAE